MSYPTFDERELDATLVKMHQSPVQEQLASSAKSGHPAGLTSKWLERLGDKCMILDMETDGVLVLAAQDPSIVGNKYYQGDDFASINGQSVHTMVLTPFDKHGKRIIIPDGVKVGLDEVTDPQELTELIRLASKLRQQRGDVGRPSTHTASRTPKTR